MPMLFLCNTILPQPPLLLRLSCYILLFAEARVGKEWAGKLEEDTRSQKNCRHISSLLTGTAAITVDMLYSLVVDPADIAIMLPQGLFRWSLYRFTEQKWPVVKGLHRDTHMQCCKWSQLSHNCIYKTRGESKRLWGERAWPPSSLLICSFPTKVNQLNFIFSTKWTA